MSEIILLLCTQPWFLIDKCDSKPIKVTWKSIFWIRNPKNLSPHWNYQVCDMFSPFLLVLNHSCQSRIKVACKVAKSFLTLFPVTLVKVELQESSLHQMNHEKVYFLTCFMQNVQKINRVGCRALNDRSNHCGPPCTPLLVFFSIFWWKFRNMKTWAKLRRVRVFLNFLSKEWVSQTT